MAKARILIPVKKKDTKGIVVGDGQAPDLAIYHVTSRVVHREFLLQDEEKEQFRIFMRMYERFTGCRILSYCMMTNHFHILLEVPPLPRATKELEFGISEEELLHRLGGLYSRTTVVGVATEIRNARRWIEGDYEGFDRLSAREQKQNRAAGQRELAAIFERYTRRMHDLSKFMKGVLQRFSRWFNKKHGLRGTLWEERFNSVIVESGIACRTMTAYIDLNPVRAGITEEPGDYRWSSYGEAVSGGRGSNKAKSGLVRALHAHEGNEGAARAWAQGGVAKEYRRILLSEGIETANTRPDGSRVVARKGRKRKEAEDELRRLEEENATDMKIGKVVQCRVRYFVDGGVLGSRSFVDGVFENCREKFGRKRKTGARKPRGALRELSKEIWSLRDLQKE